MTALILFACTFTVVLSLSLQSLNVNGGHKFLAVLTSFSISTCNLLLLKIVPQPTLMIDNIAYLAGGPFGVIAAMTWHPAIVRWSKRMTARRKAEA